MNMRKSFSGRGREQGLATAGLALLLALPLVLGACDAQTRQAAAPAAEAVADEHWKLVQAYIDSDTAWHRIDDEIKQSEDSAEEKQRRRKHERGDHPVITLALRAAEAILAAEEHPKQIAAAEFLMEHPSESEMMDKGAAALAKLVGPDWQQVQDYQAAAMDWNGRQAAIAEEAADEEEQRSREAELGDRPKPLRAIAAALAILDAADHAERRAAAEFLVNDLGVARNASAYAYRGAEALWKQFRDYDDWPTLLGALDRRRYTVDEKVDAFLEEVGNDAADPLVRATARYYLTKGLMRAADRFDATPEARATFRERALAAATGLAAGVEDAELLDPRVYGDDGEPEARPMAEVEASLVHRINHTTVGGTLPEVAAQNLDGTEDTLAAYAGKVVLIDFWATWCGPCVAALPDLRDLVDKLPPQRFALLSVSVDEELETVTAFQKDEPMPWVNWHVGEKSALAELWDVRAFPTYVLVDGEGVILARSNHLGDRFMALIEEQAGEAQSAGEKRGDGTEV